MQLGYADSPTYATDRAPLIVVAALLMGEPHRACDRFCQGSTDTEWRLGSWATAAGVEVMGGLAPVAVESRSCAAPARCRSGATRASGMFRSRRRCRRWQEDDIGQDAHYTLAGMVAGPLHFARRDDHRGARGLGSLGPSQGNADRTILAAPIPRCGEGQLSAQPAPIRWPRIERARQETSLTPRSRKGAW